MSSLEHTRGKPSFWLTATKDQARDTGMALTLVCLIVFLVTKEHRSVTIGVLVLLVNMTVPSVFKPVAKLWFGLSHILGTVMSKVILTLTFFLVLVPMGWIRRLCGKDAMRMRAFGRDQSSAFRVRDHQFTPGDIEHPY
jgi:hypothetical protein